MNLNKCRIIILLLFVGFFVIEILIILGSTLVLNKNEVILSVIKIYAVPLTIIISFIWTGREVRINVKKYKLIVSIMLVVIWNLLMVVTSFIGLNSNSGQNINDFESVTTIAESSNFLISGVLVLFFSSGSTQRKPI